LRLLRFGGGDEIGVAGDDDFIDDAAEEAVGGCLCVSGVKGGWEKREEDKCGA